MRSLIVAAGTVPLGFGLVTLAWTVVTDPGRQRRGFHDVIASSVVLDVRWDDPWCGANDDIDLVLVARDSGGSEVALDPSACPTYNGQRPQTGLAAHTPWERLECTLPGTVTTAAVRLRVDAGTGAGHRVWLQNYADLPQAWWAYERSISIPSDAREAITIGALGSAPGDQFVRDLRAREL